MPNAARAYIGAVVAAGTAIGADSVFDWDSKDLIRFSAFLAMTWGGDYGRHAQPKTAADAREHDNSALIKRGGKLRSHRQFQGGKRMGP